MTGQQSENGGTGSRFATVVTILAGVSALVATLLTFVSVWLQSKNYRKPLLQRYVIRILLMVPVYSAASWASLTSLKVAFWIDPFRDVYEAFTLYAFFQLLINFLGGERSLIIMMHGRAPVSHIWPLNHCLPKVDISDPHTFLAVKRGILQYTWIKPVLAISTIAMKATGVYKEGYTSVDSGYLWSGIVYNLSITVSLYALALFWVCMSADLQPFRPMPKFLCIKGIIFASYWQGFFLSILVWVGAIPDMSGKSNYTADNLAAAIQDALICFEMPLFAIAHWYAFSWHDYADKTISDARMPVKFALRDAFGPRDLIEDAKETFYGTQYEYRNYDADDNVMAHEDSRSREARIREGMRYERGGRGKYWLPEASTPDAKTPLLPKLVGSRARGMSPDGGSTPKTNGAMRYATNEPTEDAALDPEDERLYTNARVLEFGDWNYPVINTHYATREDRFTNEPNILTVSGNRNLLQPTAENKQRRKSRIQDLQDNAHQGEPRASSSSSDSKKKSGFLGLGRKESHDSSTSSHSRHSQLVDLVVEDSQAEAVERVRARKEGSAGWNEIDQKHYVKTYPDEDEEEEVRQGFNPDKPNAQKDVHDPDAPFAIGEADEQATEEGTNDEAGHSQPWETRNYSDDEANGSKKKQDYDGFQDEERNAWAKDQDGN